ncbi:hypothetical protein TIFTF001_055453 [Ficus carica]|uniref:Uncharacterized protein n=1 Tax=Ficus carica TaxID=3494 RepID=A0AA88EJW8_FICCA|nr:hypothetical protein TIFTF001_055453 [Ficus carica]
MPLSSLSPVSQLFSVSGDFPASDLPHLRLENAFIDAVVLFIGSRNHDGGRRGTQFELRFARSIGGNGGFND